MATSKAQRKSKAYRSPDASAEERAKRLDFLLRRIIGEPLAALASKFDYLNMDTMQGWLVCRHGGLTAKGAEKITRMAKEKGLNVAPEWLLEGIEPGPTVADIVKLFHNANKSIVPTTEKSTANKDEKLSLMELNLFKEHHKNTIAYSIQDDSMLAYLSGDLIAGIKQIGKKIDALIHQVCIVETKTGETVLRKIKEKNSDGGYTLICTNLDSSVENLVMRVEIISAATVIWHRKIMP